MEKKVNENVNEIKESESEKVEVIKEVKTKMFIERESFIGSDNKKYWSYFLPVEILKKNKKIRFVPKDRGGYEVIDLLFELSNNAELIITDNVMKDDNGRKTRYSSYKIVTYTDAGIALEATVKPLAESDKNLLTIVLRLAEGNKGV